MRETWDVDVFDSMRVSARGGNAFCCDCGWYDHLQNLPYAFACTAVDLAGIVGPIAPDAIHLLAHISQRVRCDSTSRGDLGGAGICRTCGDDFPK